VNGAALGVLWLMINKPGWATSVGVVIGATVIGAAAGAILARRGAPSAQTTPSQRSGHHRGMEGRP
jgi:hypothetical protein